MSERSEAVPADEGESDIAAKESRGSVIWREVKGLLWVLVAVLLFHSFVAKPFYIPSESMMPRMLVGDRLVVTKYPYGWSWVSPSFHLFPHWRGRLLGRMPQPGDIVIVTPPGATEDYIKRVIALPGDTVEIRGGRLILNGKPVKSEVRPDLMLPVDANAPCTSDKFYNRLVDTPSGPMCRLPIVHETLPNGVGYDTIDEGVGLSEGDDYGPIKVPADHVFLMGDNRDHSADSRYRLDQLGLGGPVPWENIGGRAEFITFSLDGSSKLTNPISFFTAMRDGRAGTSLRGQKD